MKNCFIDNGTDTAHMKCQIRMTLGSDDFYRQVFFVLWTFWEEQEGYKSFVAFAD